MKIRLKLACQTFSLMIATLAACADEPKDSVENLTVTCREVLKPSEVRREEGFAYVGVLTAGRPGDQGARSACVLLENGPPLASPHASHADIRAKGHGHYSHWNATSVYFSTGDNSDPRTNGREYALVSPQQVRRHTLTRTLREAQEPFQVESASSHPVQNISLTLRNVDSRATVIPKLSVQGCPDFTSIDGMLKSVVRQDMTDEAKSLALWKLLVDWRYHGYPAEDGDEVHDPVKLINVYGYGFCDDSASCLAVLSRAAGMRARIHGLGGHVVGEVFYAGGWHMFDPDHQIYYRMPAGHIASVEELAAHPEVITATPKDPAGSDSTSVARLYTTTEDNKPDERAFDAGLRLEPKLLPHDEVTFEFIGNGRAHMVEYRNEPPPVSSLGRLVRPLDLTSAKQQTTVRVEWPYVMLGGELDLQLTGPQAEVEVAILADKGRWLPLPAQIEGTRARVSLDSWFSEQNKAHYALELKLVSKGKRAISEVVRDARLTTLFQCATRPLPCISPGSAHFEFHAKSGDSKPLPVDWQGIEIIQKWDEVLD